MTRRVIWLIAIELVLAAGGIAAISGRADPGGQPVLPLVALTLAFAVLAVLPPLHVELRRNAYSLVLTEPLLVLALFLLDPLAAVAAGVVGELAMAAWHRQPLLKWCFNLAQTLTGTVAAVLTFTLFGELDAVAPSAWFAILVTLGAFTVFNTGSMAAVLAISEETHVLRVARRLLPTAAVNFVASSSLAVAAVILVDRTPLGPVLFVPVLGLLVLATRGYEAQRADRDRFERLYVASSRLAPLLDLQATIGAVAAEARDLVTGAAALCCTRDAAGGWIGVVVDDAGTRDAPPDVVEAARRLGAEEGAGEVPLHTADSRLRSVTENGDHVVWAARQGDATLVLAVVRDVPADGYGDRRADILSAFAQQSALVAANAALHEAVQVALQREIELNRQKSEFVAAVSHELRTPLTGILGSIQTIRRLGSRLAQEEQDRMLVLGIDQAHRLRRLIDDLLVAAAGEHGKMQVDRQVVDVPRLVTSICDELAELAGGRVRVLVGDGLDPVVTDEEKVRRIVVNLVENAVKYAPDGPIVVEVGSATGAFVVAVSDHGPGVPAADRERVFERFVQLDQSSTRRQGGTGLGLYLARQLARLLDGDLVVTDHPGGGARFVLEVQATPAPADERGAPPGVVRRRPTTVLSRPAAAGPAGRARPELTTGSPR